MSAIVWQNPQGRADIIAQIGNSLVLHPQIDRATLVAFRDQSLYKIGQVCALRVTTTHVQMAQYGSANNI